MKMPQHKRYETMISFLKMFSKKTELKLTRVIFSMLAYTLDRLLK
jgi:hypothetical protein